MVSTWRPPTLKAPKLQTANYDPWAAWKAGQDPYVSNLTAAPANANGAYTADIGANATTGNPYGVTPNAQDWQEWQGDGMMYAQRDTTPPPNPLTVTDPKTRPDPNAAAKAAGAIEVTPATQAAQAAGNGAVSFLNDWAYGGDQIGGGQYVNGRWVHGAPVAAGTDLGTLGVAKTTGFVLPVGYDSRLDTGRYELNGQVGETAWSRVLRKAQEFMQGGQTAFQDAFNRALAIVTQEAAAQGKTTGFGAATAADSAQGGGGGGATSGAGGATGGGGGGGNGGLFLSEAELGAARDSLPMAIAAYRKGQGGGIDRSIMGDYRENMMGNAVRAFLTMLGPDGTNTGALGQGNAGMAAMMEALKSGNGVGNLLRQQASRMLGQDMSNFSDEQILSMAGAASGAGGFGYGPFAQYALDNNLADMENVAQQNFLGGGRTAALADPNARARFTAAMQRYLGQY